MQIDFKNEVFEIVSLESSCKKNRNLALQNKQGAERLKHYWWKQCQIGTLFGVYLNGTLHSFKSYLIPKLKFH
jgi:hypothetical protein